MLDYCTAKKTGVSHKELEIPALSASKCPIIMQSCLELVTGKAVGIWCLWNSWYIVLKSRYCVRYIRLHIFARWPWIQVVFKWQYCHKFQLWEVHKPRPSVWVESGSHRHWFNSEVALVWDVALLQYECQLAYFIQVC